MNPTLDISVNRKSRAAAAATGMVTVGALVDVRVGGLDEIEIPDWGEGDGWTGKSLRLRVVDPFGHDVVRFPLADGDAWVQDGDGYSATVDFGTDRMRAAFRGIPFDEAMTFGLILDSSVDRAQYAVGSVTVGNWTPATYEDPTILPDWRETLADLNGRLDATEAARASAEASASAAAADAESAAANAEATAGDVAETEKNLAAVVSVKEVVATTMQDIAGLTADAEQYAGSAAASAKSAIAALGDASSSASAAAAYANEAKYNAAEAASAATAAASEAAKSAVEDAMGKVLDGETLKTNTTNAMRNAIRAIGKALGASVACLAMACGAATVSRQSLNEMDLDKDPQVVTNVTFEGLATVEDLKGVVPADYAAVSNAAMGAAAYADDRAAAVSNDLAEAISSHADDKSNPHGVTASQVGAMPASEGAEIWAYLTAENFRVTVTNYNSAVNPPRAYYEYRLTTNDDWRVVWSETNGLASAVAEATSLAAIATAEEIAKPENRAWGRYDSQTGLASPDGVVQVSASGGMLIGSEMAWTSVSATEGAYWVLTSTDPSLCQTGTNGVFEIADADGNSVMRIRKGDKRLVPAPASAMGGSPSEGAMTVDYTVASASAPTAECATDLAGPWYAEGDTAAPFAISWSGTSGAWRMTVTTAGAWPTKGYFRAQYETGGSTVVSFGAAVELTKVTIGGVEYAAKVETIDGRKHLILE